MQALKGLKPEVDPSPRVTGRAGVPSLAIQSSWLLALYAMVPLVFVLVVLDQSSLTRWLEWHLPATPENLLWFTLIFNLPHIVASSLGFLDREYLTHYRKKLLVPVPLLIGAAFVLPKLMGQSLFLSALYAWTVVHVMGQQFGIARMLCRVGDWRFQFWKWTGTTLAGLIYYGIFAVDVGNDALRANLSLAALLLLPMLLGATLLMHQGTRESVGRKYLWANFLMVAAIAYFFRSHYPFFVVLIPRVLHDVTAFVFYATHDSNRAEAAPRANAVFRTFRFSGLPVWLLSPLLAILIAAPLTLYRRQGWALSLAIAVSLVHYYTDGFVWKQGSLHRKSVRIV